MAHPIHSRWSLELSTSQWWSMGEGWKTKNAIKWFVCLFLFCLVFLAVFLLTNLGLVWGFYISRVWASDGCTNEFKRKSWNFLNMVSFYRVHQDFLSDFQSHMTELSFSHDWAFILTWLSLTFCIVNRSFDLSLFNLQPSLPLFSIKTQQYR